MPPVGHKHDAQSVQFRGEQTDPETGFTFLRARYLNPSLGRFLSADSVQPTAPGTQGYNLYAYVANNPTTWLGLSAQSGNVLGYDLVGTTRVLAPVRIGPLGGADRVLALGGYAITEQVA